MGGKGACSYPWTTQMFAVLSIIQGSCKATNFKFCMHILSIDRNKSPLQISGKVAVGALRTLEIFQGSYILGTSRSHLCDSSAFLFFLFARLNCQQSLPFTIYHLLPQQVISLSRIRTPEIHLFPEGVESQPSLRVLVNNIRTIFNAQTCSHH